MLTMGGQTSNVVFDATAAHFILKDRKLGRNKFTEMVVTNGFGLSADDCEKFCGYNEKVEPGKIPAVVRQEKLNAEYLLKTERVNELTAEFISVFRKQVADTFADEPGQVNLYEWLRTIMFTASTTAFWGDRILKAIPNLEELFFTFDQEMLSMFYGLPDFMISRQIANRERIHKAVSDWYATAEKETGGVIADPATVAWEPIYGSRLSRARQLYSREQGLSARGIAGTEVGSLFGLSSNAIPATGWMLFHILDTIKDTSESTLYTEITSEIQASKNDDGTINVALLVNQPILQSTMHEVLRMYVDTLITREIDRDMSLPLTSEKSDKPRFISVKKNSLVIMPTYPAHTNPCWQSVEYPHHPPANVFYPYRFLTSDPSDPSQKPVFTTAHAAGKFFPFGGGRTVCPGRIFAKQEIVGGVAIMLDTFDFKVLGYLDEQKKPSEKFPFLRDSLPGSALMVPGGDMKLSVTRR